MIYIIIRRILAKFVLQNKANKIFYNNLYMSNIDFPYIKIYNILIERKK